MKKHFIANDDSQHNHKESKTRPPKESEDSDDKQLVVLKESNKYRNIIDVSLQTKGYSLSKLLKISEISTKHINKDFMQDIQNTSQNYLYSTHEGRSNLKYQRLTDSIKLKILDMHYSKLMNYQQISSRLHVSYSSVRRVVLEFNKSAEHTNSWFDMNKI